MGSKRFYSGTLDIVWGRGLGSLYLRS
jgi:hypothetical protein